MFQHDSFKHLRGPSLTALGLAAALAGCSEKPKGDAALADWKEVAKLPAIPQLANPGEALQRIKSGELSHNVLEVSSPKGEAFTYVFVGNRDEKPVLLRGVFAGPERTEFLAGLQSARASPQGKVANELSSVDVKNEARPWYSEIFVDLVKTGTTLGLLYVAFTFGTRKFSEMVQSIRFRFGEDDDTEEVGKKKGVKRKLSLERPDETFKDVGGSFAAIDRLSLIVADIEGYRLGKWADLPRGILFSGSEGTGKTHTARALAGEVGGVFMATSANELTSSPFIGAWGSKVTRLFEKARAARDHETERLQRLKGATGDEQGVVFVFIDEFDSVGSSRRKAHAHDEQIRVVNALLSEMDHIDRDRNKGIILVAATNNLDALDKALLRPGRFREQIPFSIPRSADEREDVLHKAARRILRDSEMNGFTKELRKQLASITVGYSQDRLRDVLSEVVRTLKREKTETITLPALLDAMLVSSAGLKSSREPPQKRHELIMGHEHGHGFISTSIGYAPLVVSAQPRGATLGLVLTPAGALLESVSTRDDLLKSMLLLAGGRAGELVYGGLGSASDGVGSDFPQLRDLARTFLKTAMRDGVSVRGSLRMDENDDTELNKDVDRLASLAVTAAKRILETLGRDEFKAMVNRSISERLELVGPAAGKFYEGYYRPKAGAVREVVQQFMNDPFSFADEHTRIQSEAPKVNTEAKPAPGKRAGAGNG